MPDSYGKRVALGPQGIGARCELTKGNSDMLQRIREGQIRNLKDAREAGFTLIELLIVIVVLGVLAGIVVFGVSTFKSDSETAACNATKKTVSVAAEAYNAKVGNYPNGADNAARLAQLTGGGYISPNSTIPATVLLSTAGVVSGTC